MSAVCLEPRKQKLVDARFVRALSPLERARLEQHLTGCASCTERYRRMHFAQRVAAVGPERAFDTPSFQEVERIAADLGLVEPSEPAQSSFLNAWALGAATAALSILVTAVVVTAPTDQLTPRGAPAEVSVSSYIVTQGQAPRRLEEGSKVRPAEHLKLRLSGAKAAPVDLETIHVVLVGSDGRARLAALAPPSTSSGAAASVEGSVSLSSLPAGAAAIYVILTRTPLDSAVLERTFVERPAAEDARAQLDVLHVERIDVSVESAP